MTDYMSVLVVEQERGCAANDMAELIADHDVIYQCYPESWGAAPRAHHEMCVGVTDHACPLELGVDVALVVRGAGGTTATGIEAGAQCALRQGVPLAVHGATAGDPYYGYAAAHVTDSVVGACNEAVQTGFDRLKQRILSGIRQVIADAELTADAFAFRFATYGRNLEVAVVGPPMRPDLQQRLAIRAADAIRDADRSFAKTSVAYEVAF